MRLPSRGVWESFTPEEELGYQIFNSEVADCFHCHGDLNTGNIFGAYGDLQFSNNGLDSILKPNTGYEVVTLDSNDRAKFKIPSLRNVDYSFPYMHDGRFKSLTEVMGHYSSPKKASPTVSLEGVMLTAAIEAHKQRYIACFDIPGAFLHAKCEDGDIYMLLRVGWQS